MWEFKKNQLCVVGIVAMFSYSEISTCGLAAWKTWPRPRGSGLDLSLGLGVWPRLTSQLFSKIPVCIILIFIAQLCDLGYRRQRADERHGNPPRGNQELLVVRDKAGRSPGELGVSKSM